MNRIDRLFAITLHLQRKQRLRAQDLARLFEVSERTIYRDIAALSESGVPIVSLPGDGYELMEGFYLPPLLFTPDEAGALFLGAQMLVAHATGQLPADAENALAKLALVLPKATRAEVDRRQAILNFAIPALRFDLDEPKLATLQKAIRASRVVWLRYHAYNHNEVSEREVEPIRLTYYSGAWYVVGYCRLREDWRSFRLERIDGLKLLKKTFTPRTGSSTPGEPIQVSIRFAAEIVRWVRERQHYGFTGEESEGDGQRIIMHYQVEALSEIKAWLLSRGDGRTPRPRRIARRDPPGTAHLANTPDIGLSVAAAMLRRYLITLVQTNRSVSDEQPIDS
jgi:predicted DNA-binding transcriptional regulator YafY